MMPIESSKELRAWLERQMERRGWSMRQTSLNAGLAHSRIQQIMTGDPPGIEVCIALAELFNVQLELVLYLAGYPVRDPRERFDESVGMLADGIAGLHPDIQVPVIHAVTAVLELAMAMEKIRESTHSQGGEKG